MVYGFDSECKRTIIAASPMFYRNGDPHPTRLLDFHDIFYMVDGYWRVRLEDEEIEIKTGDIVTLPAAYRHYGEWQCRAKTRTIFIHFSYEKKDRVIQEYDKTSMLSVQSLSHDNGALYPLFQEIVKVFSTNISHKEMRCRAILNLLLAELSDIYMQRNIKRDQRILECIDLIVHHPDIFYSIEELAQKMHISPKSFTSRFRSETGQSVHKYQMNRKLDQIAMLLRTESYTSLKNLALNYGFYDEFHLSASFKKKFGVSPAGYSKNVLPIS
jgi:AraC-like DNA-binding protein